MHKEEMSSEYERIFGIIFKGTTQIDQCLNILINHITTLCNSQTTLYSDTQSLEYKLPIIRPKRTLHKLKGPDTIQKFEVHFNQNWERLIHSFIQFSPSLITFPELIQGIVINKLTELKNNFSKSISICQSLVQKSQSDFNKIQDQCNKSQKVYQSSIRQLEEFLTKNPNPTEAQKDQFNNLIQTYSTNRNALCDKMNQYNIEAIKYTNCMRSGLHIYENSVKELYDAIVILLQDSKKPFKSCGTTAITICRGIQEITLELNDSSTVSKFISEKNVTPIEESDATLVTYSSPVPDINIFHFIPISLIFTQEQLKSADVILLDDITIEKKTLKKGQKFSNLGPVKLSKKLKVMNQETGEIYEIDKKHLETPENLQRSLMKVKNAIESHSLKQNDVVMTIETNNEQALCLTAFNAKIWIPLSNLEPYPEK